MHLLYKQLLSRFPKYSQCLLKFSALKYSGSELYSASNIHKEVKIALNLPSWFEQRGGLPSHGRRLSIGWQWLINPHWSQFIHSNMEENTSRVQICPATIYPILSYILPYPIDGLCGQWWRTWWHLWRWQCRWRWEGLDRSLQKECGQFDPRLHHLPQKINTIVMMIRIVTMIVFYIWDCVIGIWVVYLVYLRWCLWTVTFSAELSHRRRLKNRLLKSRRLKNTLWKIAL